MKYLGAQRLCNSFLFFMVGLKILMATNDMVDGDFHQELKSGMAKRQTVCSRKSSCISKYHQSYHCQLEFSKLTGI